jgi:hypothetical protein
LTCDVKVLVSEVLLASISSVPIFSPLPRRQTKMACDALPTTHAKRIGNTLGPYTNISIATNSVELHLSLHIWWLVRASKEAIVD